MLSIRPLVEEDNPTIAAVDKITNELLPEGAQFFAGYVNETVAFKVVTSITANASDALQVMPPASIRNIAGMVTSCGMRRGALYTAAVPTSYV